MRSSRKLVAASRPVMGCYVYGCRADQATGAHEAHHVCSPELYADPSTGQTMLRFASIRIGMRECGCYSDSGEGEDGEGLNVSALLKRPDKESSFCVGLLCIHRLTNRFVLIC